MQQFFIRLWSYPPARAPLVLSGIIVVLTAGWLFWPYRSPVSAASRAPSLEVAVPTQVVVRGQIRLPSGRFASIPSQPVTVHLSIPEAAYQADVTLDPEGDGRYEIAVNVPKAAVPLRYNLELSVGEMRWVALADQPLSLTTRELESPILDGVPPNEANPRAHLSKRPVLVSVSVPAASKTFEDGQKARLAKVSRQIEKRRKPQ